MDSKSFKIHLQYLIIKGLKPIKRNINVKGQVSISERLFNQLKKNGVTGRFKTNVKLIGDLNLNLRRYSDQNQYCQCKPDTFRIRVGRQTPAISFNPTSSSELQPIHKFPSGAFIFAFEFIRYEYTQ